MWRSFALSCLLLPALATSAPAARDRSGECGARKLAVASADTRSRLEEQARALRKHRAPSFARCDTRLVAKYARVERVLGSICPTLGEAGSVRAASQRFVEGLAITTQGGLHCSEDLRRLEQGTHPVHPAPASFQPVGSGGVLQLAEGIYMAPGFGNTFLVVTPEGNVVIDTSLSLFAPGHVQALRAIDDGPVRFIILTHGHNDHTGGVALWREDGTQVIAQREQTELLHYSARIAGLLNHRSFEQFSVLLGLPARPFSAPDAPVEDYGAELF